MRAFFVRLLTRLFDGAPNPLQAPPDVWRCVDCTYTSTNGHAFVQHCQTARHGLPVVG